jgi:hypothetical protein
METSLHRELKALYASGGAKTEVPLESYRIDVVTAGELVEIQHGSLAAIRDKVARLLEDHRVLVVKPLVVRKTLVKQDAKGGQIIGRRLSPKQGTVLSLFDELVYFTRVFPHRNLTLEAPLVEIEEWRYPGHGKRRRWRAGDQVVEDQRLVTVRETHRFRTAADLARLLPAGLPAPFHTGHLSEQLGTPRHVAQRIAYCLLKVGATREVGKERNSRLYRLSRAARAA